MSSALLNFHTILKIRTYLIKLNVRELKRICFNIYFIKYFFWYRCKLLSFIYFALCKLIIFMNKCGQSFLIFM